MNGDPGSALVIGAVRTPIGRHGGALSGWNPADLLGQTICALLHDLVAPDAIDEVVVGCSAPVGAQAHNIARLGALAAGLPETTPAHTVDDGHRALRSAIATIAAGLTEVVLVGGIDIASLLPPDALTHDLPDGPRSRLLTHRSNTWSPRNPVLLAEALAANHDLTRDELDDYTLTSHTNARAASDPNPAIIALRPPPGPLTHDAAPLDHDEHLTDTVSRDTLASHPPTYQRDGRITRANSAPRADGAAAALLATPNAAQRLALPTAATIAATATAADGTVGLTGHIAATRRALPAAGTTTDDIAVAYIDETFAATAVAWQHAFDIDAARINPTGGAVATGNAPGATPIGQLAELLNALSKHDRAYGLLATANPDGTGLATVLSAAT